MMVTGQPDWFDFACGQSFTIVHIFFLPVTVFLIVSSRNGHIFFGGGEPDNLFVLGERRGNKQDTFPYFSTESGSIHKFPHVLSGNWP